MARVSKKVSAAQREAENAQHRIWKTAIYARLYRIFIVMKKENKAMKEMKEKIYDARTGMEYILIGDYYLPALKVPRTRPVGRWGMLHKAYLKLRKPGR